MKLLVRAFLLLFILASIVVGLAFTSPIQTAIAKSFLKDLDPDVQLDSVSAGFSSCSIDSLGLNVDGTKVRLKSADIEYSLFSFLGGGPYDVSNIRVEGLVVDLSQSNPKPKAKGEDSSAAPFEGVFKSLDVPLQLSALQLKAGLQVILPDSKLLNGSLMDDSVNDQFGITFYGNFLDKAIGAPVEELSYKVKASFVQDVELKINKISAEASTRVEKAQQDYFIGQMAMVTAVLENHGLSEKYRSQFYIAPRGKEAQEILDVDVQLEGANLIGTYEVTTSSSQVAPFIVGQELPEFSLQGKGKFTVGLGDMSVRLNSSVGGAVGGFEKFQPELASLGNLGFRSEADVLFSGDVLKLQGLDFQLTRKSENLAVLKLLKPFSYNVNNRTMDAQGAQGDLLTVKLNKLSLPLFSGFIPSEYNLHSGTLDSELVVKVSANGTPEVRTLTPLKLEGVRISDEQFIGVDPVSLAAEIEFLSNLETTNFELKNLSVSKASPFLVGNLKGVVVAPSGETPKVKVAGNTHLGFQELLSLRAVESFKSQLPAEIRGSSMAFQLSASPAAVKVDSFSLQVQGNDNSVLVSTKLDKPLAFAVLGMDPMRLLNGHEIPIQLQKLPLSIANPYIAPNNIYSGDLTASIAIGQVGDKIQIIDKGGILVRNLYMADGNGNEMLKGINVKVTPSVDYNLLGGELRLDKTKIGVTDAMQKQLVGAVISAIILSGEKTTVQGSIQASVDVPSLANQPAVPMPVDVRSGKLNMNGDFIVADDITFKGQLETKALEVGYEKLPSVYAKVDVKKKMDGTIVASVPVTVSYLNRVSDIGIKTLIKPEAKGQNIQLQIDSKNIILDDLLRFQALSGSSDNSSPRQPNSKSKPGPEWAGVSGVFNAKIDNLVMKQGVVQDIQLSTTIDPSKVELTGLSAKIEQAALQAKGSLTYQQRAREPYHLTSELGLQGLDIQKAMLFAGQPLRPDLKGTLNVSGRFSGGGSQLDTLQQNLTGDVSIQALNGVLPGYKPTGELRNLLNVTGAATQVGDLAGGLLGIAGAFDKSGKMSKIHNEVSKGTAKAKAGLAIVNRLKVVPFQDLRLSLSKRKGHAYDISELLLKSSDLFIRGKGQIGDGPLKSIMDQPLYVSLDAGVGGPLIGHMNSLKLITDQVVSGSYQMFKKVPLNFGGTLNDVDVSELTDLLKESVGVKEVAQPQQNLNQNQQGQPDVKEQLINEGVKQGLGIMKGLGIFGN